MERFADRLVPFRSSDDFTDRLAVVKKGHRPSSAIGDGGRGVNTEVVVERREDILKGNGSVLDVGGLLVRRADDLAGPHAAAGQQGEIDRRPVVPAGSLVDDRRAAELAPDDDRDILVQPALMKVFDQRGEGHVELGNSDTVGGEVVGVRIPAAESDRHDPNTRFDQSPSHQEVIHAAGRTVLLVGHIPHTIPGANPRILPRDVECFINLARGQHLEGSLSEAVYSANRLVVVEVTAKPVKLPQE